MEAVETASGSELAVRRAHFSSQQYVTLSMDVITKDAEIRLSDLESVMLIVVDNPVWQEYSGAIHAGLDSGDSNLVQTIDGVTANSKSAVVLFCPRGIGLSRWEGDEKKQIQIRRRFQMIGTTVDAARVWDIRRAIHVLRDHMPDLARVDLIGRGKSSGLVLAASLFEKDLTLVQIDSLPDLHSDGPVFLNSHRFLDSTRLLLLSMLTNKVTTGRPVEDAMIKRITGDARWQGYP